MKWKPVVGWVGMNVAKGLHGTRRTRRREGTLRDTAKVVSKYSHAGCGCWVAPYTKGRWRSLSAGVLGLVIALYLSCFCCSLAAAAVAVFPCVLCVSYPPCIIDAQMVGVSVGCLLLLPICTFRYICNLWFVFTLYIYKSSLLWRCVHCFVSTTFPPFSRSSTSSQDQ